MKMLMAALLLSCACSLPAAPRLWVLRAPDEIALPEIAPKHLEVVDRDAISYWSAGPPNYRWNEVMFELFSSSDADVVPERVAAALHIAIHDAAVAAASSEE